MRTFPWTTRSLRTLFPLMLLACAGCAPSLDLPTIEESNAVIERVRPMLARADDAVRAWASRLPSDHDIVVRLRLSVLDRAMTALAGSRSDDLRIAFLPTRPLVREEKSTLGIRYTNTLDLDGGDLTLNLRSLRFSSGSNSVVARLEIEGRGRIAASGVYLGVPATASPDVELRLADSVRFDLRIGSDGTVQLVPRQSVVQLRVTLSVSLLGWRLPYSHDVPLQVKDLLPPISLPLGMSPEFPFPMPATTPGDDRVEFVPHRMVLTRGRATLQQGVIEYRTDASFERVTTPAADHSKATGR